MAVGTLKCQDKRMANKEKEDRLAAALRENLRRRKAQSRTLAEQSERHRQGHGNGDEDAN